VEVLDVPKVRLVGESAHVKPVTGDMLDVRAMAPVNPCSEVAVIVEGPETPARIVTVVGPAESVKSWMVNVIVAERESEPLVPVTVTV